MKVFFLVLTTMLSASALAELNSADKAAIIQAAELNDYTPIQNLVYTDSADATPSHLTTNEVAYVAQAVAHKKYEVLNHPKLAVNHRHHGKVHHGLRYNYSCGSTFAVLGLCQQYYYY